jgi:hypothetical protein
MQHFMGRQPRVDPEFDLSLCMGTCRNPETRAHRYQRPDFDSHFLGGGFGLEGMHDQAGRIKVFTDLT